MNRVCRRAGAFAMLAISLCGCSTEKPMTLNSNLNGDLKMNGDLKAGMKLEGPIQIQMQMQGPTIRYEGTYISDELLEVVKTGKTTSDWVAAVFGEPTARSELRDGSEIWRWTYKPVAQEAAVIEIFSDEKKEPKLATRTVFLQFRDGIVIEKWKG